jgi:hypothetical protein
MASVKQAAALQPGRLAALQPSQQSRWLYCSATMHSHALKHTSMRTTVHAAVVWAGTRAAAATSAAGVQQLLSWHSAGFLL